MNNLTERIKKILRESGRLLLLGGLLCAFTLQPLPAESAKKTQAKQKTAAGTYKKSAAAKVVPKKQKSSKSSTKKSKASKAAAGKGKETSSDVRRREQQTRKEIKLTEEQIRANDAAVKKNLNALGILGGDIEESKKKVSAADARVKALNKEISTLQSRIASEEERLTALRSEYLKAVKKMRAKRGETSMLAFIFSSGSFNEAMRRMRYLKQFSEWREKQTAEISRRVAELKDNTEKLSQAKNMHDRELASQLKAQENLQTQYARQDAMVAELKKNGSALKAHLSKKQAEANALNSRISALIAEEQRKAAAEQAAREKAEEERRAGLLAQQRAKEEAERAKAEPQTSVSKHESPRQEAQEKEIPKKKTPKKKTPQKETPKKEVRVSTPAEGEVSYAEARRRKPRSQGVKTTSEIASTSASNSGAGKFESMRGSLPRPVSGSFKITSRFGRQSLPDMPNVSYENPGIDAEVSAGASAQAVFGGQVSAVYVVPGYNTVVIVKHGNYYTVYGNIASAGVKVGDTVKQGQSIGRLSSMEDDPSHSSIHFEVWRNREKLDPLGWIR